MKKYNIFLNEMKADQSDLNEASLQDAEKLLKEYSKTISKVIKNLRMGITNKTVIQEMGKGYQKDFFAIVSNLDDGVQGIEELLHEIDIETKPR